MFKEHCTSAKWFIHPNSWSLFILSLTFPGKLRLSRQKGTGVCNAEETINAEDLLKHQLQIFLVFEVFAWQTVIDLTLIHMGEQLGWEEREEEALLK